MTKKRIATALALGFLAVILSILPVTTAEAGCVPALTTGAASTNVFRGLECSKGTVKRTRKDVSGLGSHVECCTVDAPQSGATIGDVTKAAGEAQEGAVAAGGTSTTTLPSTDPAIKAGCPGNYDYGAGRCIERPAKNMGKGSTSPGSPKPAAIRKAQCESQGPGYKYADRGV
jgi:hypothetical protein